MQANFPLSFADGAGICPAHLIKSLVVLKCALVSERVNVCSLVNFGSLIMIIIVYTRLQSNNVVSTCGAGVISKF